MAMRLFTTRRIAMILLPVDLHTDEMSMLCATHGAGE
jgi:hypothetical protein